MFDQLALDDDELPEPDLSEGRVADMLDDIKRNSRNRRIAMVAPLVLAAAVIGAMVAAPPHHGGFTDVADAEAPDPLLPRVFGSDGEWRLPELIEDAPEGDPGPADMIQAPTEPSSPEFTLSAPAQQELHSLPTSTSTPPTSTSGQSPDPVSPADLDWSSFRAVIRIEPEADSSAADASTDASASTDLSDSTEAGDVAEVGAADEVDDPDSVETDALDAPSEETSNESAPADATTADIPSPDGDVTVAEDPHREPTEDRPEANPSTPRVRPDDDEASVLSTPATIVPLSVPLVTGAHVSVSVQVVDDDSSVIDWCNTRVDWGDGSVTRVAGADEADLCTASCEHGSTSSSAGAFAPGPGSASIDRVLQFEHDYAATIDVAPRIFVATGDGCSYTLAELQLPPFTVVPHS